MGSCEVALLSIVNITCSSFRSASSLKPHLKQPQLSLITLVITCTVTFRAAGPALFSSMCKSPQEWQHLNITTPVVRYGRVVSKESMMEFLTLRIFPVTFNAVYSKMCFYISVLFTFVSVYCVLLDVQYVNQHIFNPSCLHMYYRHPIKVMVKEN